MREEQAGSTHKKGEDGRLKLILQICRLQQLLQASSRYINLLVVQEASASQSGVVYCN